MNTIPSARTYVMLTALLLFSSTHSGPVNAQTTLIDLGTLGGTYSEATGINDAGQIVGDSYTAGSTNSQAFLYSNGVMTNLGTLGGSSSDATGINSTGQVVGYSTAGNGAFNTFVYSNGVMQNIAPSSTVVSFGYAINDLGNVAGATQVALCSATCSAFLYSKGTLTDLNLNGTGIPHPSFGFGINNAGEVVGETGTEVQQAFIYSNGTVQYLTPFTFGTNSSATGINASGQVVGSFQTPNMSSSHAFLYSNGSLQDLGALGSTGTQSGALGINASGEVVGYSYTSSTSGVDHAFLYENGHMADLNTLDTSSALAQYVTLTEATAINTQGWIVADGVDSRTGQEHAYLLENANVPPVPLPGALWLMLSGIGGLGACVRRKRL